MGSGNRYSGGERRLAGRYPVNALIEYRIVQEGTVTQSGRGVTSDISETGLSFECDEPLAAGLDIELVLTWPGHRTLQVLASGRTLRAEDGYCAITLTRYDFHRV